MRLHMTESLWGALPTGGGMRTPHSILLEQAEVLTQQTSGVLVGRVTREISIVSDFKSTLQIVAPSLNYVYDVLSLHYSVNLYPVSVEPSSSLPGARAENEIQLKAELKRVLTSEFVRKAVSGLLAQIRADEK
jgi:hypothetical protein